ncbi:hypothetical protein FEDK69T_27070 [Flavobacterium enshiense DK69]|nr:hypothetical protein FEDK69T_27070 [Flavobacterium enshiense DK69]
MNAGTIFDFEFAVLEFGSNKPLTKNYWNIKKEAFFFM